MKKIITFAISGLVLAGCGTQTVVREVTVTPAPVVTQAPVQNKYDQYISDVHANSGASYGQTDAQLIKVGDLVCQALDEGNSFSDVMSVMESSSSGQSDIEMFAAIMYNAIKHICPEYFTSLNNYLASN